MLIIVRRAFYLCLGTVFPLLTSLAALSRSSHSIISVSDSSYLFIPLNGRIDYLPRREKVQLDQCVAEGS